VTDHAWIRTAPDMQGVYRTSVDVNDDVSFPLTRETAATYAYHILGAVAEAEYDAAIIRQLTKVTGDEKDAVQIVADLRADRPVPAKVGPLTLEPGVSVYTGKAFLEVKVDGRGIGQWDAPDAREHALAALEAVLVADLDGAYLRTRRTLVHLDDGLSRTIVGDLIKWRDGRPDPEDS
jgi:hypothetical protein